MRLAIVSDTHGHVEFTRAAIHLLHALEVEEVIHCGDIGSVEVVELFAPWTTHFVFGNVDHQVDELRSAISKSPRSQCHEMFGQIEREGCCIAFLHGHDEYRLLEAIRSQDYHLVCHGHTHVANKERVGETIVLNPGALFRATRHSVAIVDLPQLAIEHIAI